MKPKTKLTYEIIEQIDEGDSQTSEEVNAWWKKVKEEAEEILENKLGCMKHYFTCDQKNQTEQQQIQPDQICDCDKTCNGFGDCCLNLAMTNGPPPPSPEQEDLEHLHRRPKLTCSVLNYWPEVNHLQWGILMVTRCPQTRQYSPEHQYCNKKVEQESYSPALDIPVTSLATNLTYANYFCALCHDDVDRLLQTTISVRCLSSSKEESGNLTLGTLVSEAKYSPGQHKFERFLPPVYNHKIKVKRPRRQFCQIKVDQFENITEFAAMTQSRLCKFPRKACAVTRKRSPGCAMQVRDCEPSWPEPSDIAKCKSYSFKIYDRRRNVIFHNPHCAKCNFVDPKSEFLTCKFPNLLQWIQTRGAIPFSMLFQVSGIRPNRCRTRGEIWDPFFEKCIKVFCSDGLILMKGKCVKGNSNYHNSNDTQMHNTSSYLNCMMTSIQDFQVYNNGSLYYAPKKMYYTEKEYDIYNETTAFICIEDYYKHFSHLHSITTLIVLTISLICLSIHIALYLSYSRLRTWHGRNLFCLCCALFVAQFTFLTGTNSTTNFGVCFFLSVLLHYFWLVSFCWMNILSIDVWRTFKSQLYRSSMNNGRVFVYYNLYAWGIPLIIVGIALAIDLSNESIRFRPCYAGFKKAKLCWINCKMGLLYFFLLPVGIIITENFILFVMTSHRIYMQSREARFAQTKSQSVRCAARGGDSSEQKRNSRFKAKSERKNRTRFALYFKLGVLQGLTWVTGFLASYLMSPACWYLFTVLNGLQGAAIFFSFDIKRWMCLSIVEKIASTSWASRLSSRTTKSTPRGDKPQVDNEVSNRSLEKTMNEEAKLPAEEAFKWEKKGLSMKTPLACFASNHGKGQKKRPVSLYNKMKNSSTRPSNEWDETGFNNASSDQTNETELSSEAPKNGRSLQGNSTDPSPRGSRTPTLDGVVVDTRYPPPRYSRSSTLDGVVVDTIGTSLLNSGTPTGEEGISVVTRRPLKNHEDNLIVEKSDFNMTGIPK